MRSRSFVSCILTFFEECEGVQGYDCMVVGCLLYSSLGRRLLLDTCIYQMKLRFLFVLILPQCNPMRSDNVSPAPNMKVGPALFQWAIRSYLKKRKAKILSCYLALYYPREIRFVSTEVQQILPPTEHDLRT